MLEQCCTDAPCTPVGPWNGSAAVTRVEISESSLVGSEGASACETLEKLAAGSFWPEWWVQSVLKASNRLCEPYVTLNEI